MTPEGRVRTHLRKEAKHRGFEHRKLRWIARTGAPDELVFAPNGPLEAHAFVEVKRSDGRLDAHQNREIARLRRAGFTVWTIFSTEGADMLLDYLTSLVEKGEAGVNKRGLK